MLYPTLAVIAGFILLVWAADRFVLGASATARNLGVSPLLIGLTIVGFGTSAPEMLVSAVASWSGNPNLGVGNAIGSNITNVGLVLGVTALITPLLVHSATLRREFPVLFAIMALAILLLWDGVMSRLDGVVLLLGMLAMVVWMVRMGQQQQATECDPVEGCDPLHEEYAEEIPADMPMWQALGWTAVGLLLLLVSSRLLVWGAVEIAHAFGVSDLIIGLTIVAIGTSLPELAASVVSARKGEHDIAVGNVLGSNMFNLLAVLGLAGAITPAELPPEVFSRDLPAMVITALMLFVMAARPGGKHQVGRIGGILLLLAYSVYMVLLYLAAAG